MSPKSQTMTNFGMPSHLVTKCFICGRRRSSRFLIEDPESVLDSFICSRKMCYSKKCVLEDRGTSLVIQINHYCSNGIGQLDETRTTIPEIGSSNFNGDKKASSTSSPPSASSRVELYGDNCFPRVRVPDFLPDTPPPPVDYARKPSRKSSSDWQHPT